MSTRGTTRRGLLATASTGVAAATAGCFSQLRSRLAFDPAEQISLTVKTVPADSDPASIRIAQDLRENLDDVGIDVSLELLGEEQLLRDVLINHEFDAFVAEVPGHTEPDELRTALHSRFASEEGWQNPFGFASHHLDGTLESQYRQGGGDRPDLIAELQRGIVDQHPFVTLVSPTHATATSPALSVPDDVGFASPLSYLVLDWTDQADGDTTELAVALRRDHATRNHNLLAVAHRTYDRLTDLLYDPLVRRVDDEYVPWLAREWSVDAAAGTATVRLRDGLTWHDGAALTASDVAFTYRFLRDTSLAELETSVPAPRYRHRTSLVDAVEAVDDRTVTLDIDRCRPEVCPAILGVPVLPESQWRARSAADHEYLTQAIVGNVSEPVGSGPLRFESATAGESLTLSRFDDHFLRTTSDLPESLTPFAGGPNYEQLEATTTPNLGAAIADVASGSIDLVDGRLTVDAVSETRQRRNVALAEATTPSYYCVGFNARRHPLSNYTFRSAIARLLDREYLVEEVFDGLATPIESPLHATSWVPEGLRWDGRSAVAPFVGESGDLNVEAARSHFQAAGFRYHDGELRGRQ